MEGDDDKPNPPSKIVPDVVRVNGAPDSVYYLPNFLTEEEHDALWRQVYESPKPKWTQLSNRRLQNWGGHPHPKGMVCEELPSVSVPVKEDFSSEPVLRCCSDAIVVCCLCFVDVLQWLDDLCERILETDLTEGKKPNHVLVNEYEPGQGILPHSDGPLFYPVITTVNLGCHSLLEFWELQDMKNRVGAMLLEPRSLVVIKDTAYTDLAHGIREVTEDHLDESVWNLRQTKFKDKLGENLKRDSTRVSLTIRNVPKVLKVKLVGGRFVNT